MALGATSGGPKIPTIETPAERTRDALKKRGQTLAPVINTGCVQADVAIDMMESGLLSAVSDPRKGSVPLR
jgi:hypothetical protein